MNIQLIAVILLHLVCNERLDAYSHYRDLIPNGRRVTHPCKANYMWYGVGHEREQGGGVRNSFGKDFKLYGETWNECLCRLDSDQDGKTNGEELGDPECKWQPGQTPDRVAGITHPGVCDPFDDSRCENINDFLDCTVSTEFECDAIKEPDVQEKSFQLDETSVPAVETTYICQSFDLPTDFDYHFIAGVPSIDNENVMHHIIVYGCTADDAIDEVREAYRTPNTDCNMVRCQDIIFGWAVGSSGQCTDPNMGYRIGLSGYRHIIMELHWNNPEMVSHYTDSSGFTMYYTTSLRPNDGASFWLAPIFLEIPPGHLHYEKTGTCSSECTSQLIAEGESMKIVMVTPHMHYLGSKLRFEHIRDGRTINVADFPQYFYDDPRDMTFEEPIEVFGGDELKVSCWFDSVTSDSFTFYGEETSDEMCFAILTYYPQIPEGNYCAMKNGYGTCSSLFNRYNTTECDAQSYYGAVYRFQENVGDKCDKTGFLCYDECEQEVEEVKDHPCMETSAADALQAAMLSYYNNQEEDYGREVFSKLGSCDPRPVIDTSHESSHEYATCDVSTSGSSNGRVIDFELAMMCAFIALLFFKH